MRLYQAIGCAAAGGLLALSGAMAATVPVSQSFESFADGYSIVDHAAWSGGADAGIVSTNEAVITALEDYIIGGGVLPLPVATHEKVLALTDVVTNAVASVTGGVVVAEWLLLPSQRKTAPAGSDSHQMAFYVDTNSTLVVWHRNPAVPTNQWLTLAGNPAIGTSDWVRVTIHQDYATDRYQIAINGTAYTNALGETRAGSTPGSWFHMVQTNGFLSAFSTFGDKLTHVDDLVFTNRSVAYSGTAFAEAAANDGSITGSRTITLSGDTFVDTTYSAGTHFSASGVPAGLSVALTYVSPTQVTVSLTGNASPHDAAASTSAMGLTLEDDIFTLGNAADVSGYARSGLSVSFDDPPVLSYDPVTFVESVDNDGSIGNSVTVTLAGDTFTNIATLLAGTHYTTSGVPAGLGVLVVRNDATNLTVSLIGNATAHGDAADTSMTLTFLNAAFDTVAASDITDSAQSLAIAFADSAALDYSTTTYSELAANDGSISGGTISAVAEAFVGEIGTNYMLGGLVEVPNLPDGLSVAIVKESDLQVTVSFGGKADAHTAADGLSDLEITFLDGVFSGGNAAEVTDSSRSDLVIDFNDPPVVGYSGTVFSEASGNNGTIGNSVTATLAGTTLAKSGPLALTTDYTISSGSVPSGLAVSISSDSEDTLTISLTSVASPHTSSQNSSFEISFTDALFNTVAAANITGSSQSFSVSFDDQPVITYSGIVFSELSDGLIDNTTPIQITISGDTFNGVNGSDFVAAGKVVAGNVPAGLTLVLTKNSNTKLLATLSGTADEHASGDSISNLTITFLDAAITAADANQVTGYDRNNLEVAFNDSTLFIHTVPYRESFEPYADGAVMGAEQGWQTYGGGVVTSETAIVNALTGSFTDFPLVTNHTKVLRMTQDSMAAIKSGAGGTVYTDVMLYVTARAELPTDGEDYQFAMFVDTNATVNVWHRDTSGPSTNTWTVLSGVTLSTNAWHRVTVEKDYAAGKYRLYLDGNPSAVNNPTISGDWFNMVSTANNFLSFARVLGTTTDAPIYADDLVVDTLRPGFIPPPPSIFRFR